MVRLTKDGRDTFVNVVSVGHESSAEDKACKPCFDRRSDWIDAIRSLVMQVKVLSVSKSSVASNSATSHRLAVRFRTLLLSRVRAAGRPPLTLAASLSLAALDRLSLNFSTTLSALAEHPLYGAADPRRKVARTSAHRTTLTPSVRASSLRRPPTATAISARVRACSCRRAKPARRD